MNLDGRTWKRAWVSPVVGIPFAFPGVGRGDAPFGGPPPAGAEQTYVDLKKDRDARLGRVLRLLDGARAYAKAGRAADGLGPRSPRARRRAPDAAVVTAPREQDIKDAIAFADRVNVRNRDRDRTEAIFAAPQLKAARVPVILGPILTLPRARTSSTLRAT